MPYRYLDLIVKPCQLPCHQWSPLTLLFLLDTPLPVQPPRQLLLDSVASELRLLPPPPLGSVASGRLPPHPRPLVLLHPPQRK